MITYAAEPQYFRPYRTGAWHVCRDFTSRWVWALCEARAHMMDTEWAYEPPRHWRVCAECKALREGLDTVDERRAA